MTARDEPAAPAREGEELQQRVYTWLGYWRDQMPPRAVEILQDILGPLTQLDRLRAGRKP